mgnify:CR=1 FL=1
MLQVRILPGLPAFSIAPLFYFDFKSEWKCIGILIAMFKKLGNFISETRQELNKVTWPNRGELWQSTVVVILTTFMVAIYIGVIDFFLSLAIRVVLG